MFYATRCKIGVLFLLINFICVELSCGYFNTRKLMHKGKKTFKEAVI